MRKFIFSLIQKIVGQKTKFEILVPEPTFGHYSTNVALRLAKKEGKSSLELAKQIQQQLKKKAPVGFFEKIEVAPPGFLNFWLSAKTLQNGLRDILNKKDNYGAGSKKREKIQIEFISANPTGPLTIGNGRGAFFGDALVLVLRCFGYQVVGEYYINDARASNQIKELGKTALGKGKSYLTAELKKQIAKLKTRLKNLDETEAGWLLAREIQKSNQRFIEKGLKIKMDSWFSEQSLYDKKITESLPGMLKKKNLIYGKDGALWFKTKEFGDSEDRVLIRQTGEPTYFLSDLAYHLNKFKDRKFAKVIDIWGADHHGYGPRLKAALKALSIGGEKLTIIITQLVRLVERGKAKKMSKRRGEFVTLEELIKEVSLDAVRFFFLMTSPDTHLDFDLKLAKERSLKNPVYYVQYAYVRCQSILRKSKFQNQNFKNIGLLNTAEDLKLMRQLARFPEVVEDTANDYQVHRLSRYVLELAAAFHNFYEKERVIGSEKDLATARLSLVRAAVIVLTNLFNILGISLPKKM